MTKTQLLDKLKVKFYKVLPEREGETENGIVHYSVPVFDIKGEIMERRWVHFYTEGKSAYWQDSEPKPEPIIPDPTFASEVQNYIKNKINDGTIEGAAIEQTDEQNGKAIVKAYNDEAGIKEKRVLIDKDGSGKLRHRLIE